MIKLLNDAGLHAIYAFCFLAASSLAQTTEEVCKEVSCRPSNELILFDTDGGHFKIQSGKLPFVYKEDIILLPGDTDYVEFQNKDEKYGRPKLVDFPTDKKRTV